MDITPRQKEVMRLISDGLSQREVADKMGISLSCVEKYISQVRERTDTRSLCQAVKVLVKEGVIYSLVLGNLALIELTVPSFVSGLTDDRRVVNIDMRRPSRGRSGRSKTREIYDDKFRVV